MDDVVLLKGNEAIAESAIRSGCKHYYGYPITPQTEIAAYMSKKMPEIGGVFLQAESEIAAINMVMGTAATGKRTMTSSSSPGISLKQEGISYLAGSELPAVIVNITRAGPGLGGILPAQSDYFQAVKGGGHGDYRLISLAPGSVQEMYDMTTLAFDLADKYRTPVYIIADGMLGQVMEPVKLGIPSEIDTSNKEWATTGTGLKRKPNVITSLRLKAEELEELNSHLQKKYKEITKNEVRAEFYRCDNAELVIVSYGSMARINKNVINSAREKGIKVGMIRPITLWPFPTNQIQSVIKNAKAFISIEMSEGQMVEDVRLSVNGERPVYFYGKSGGIIPTQEDILDEIYKICEKDNIN